MFGAVASLIALAAATFGPADFLPPVAVEISGYEGHAMEPFISRDGAWLFFNNRNQPQDQTDIHVARRVDETRFAYIGILEGARSDDLDGVPSMDRDGVFYFISPRAYSGTRNTLWTGHFENGEIDRVAQLDGDASRRKPFRLNIDAEISANGQTLYFTDNRWNMFRGAVGTSNLVIAKRGADVGFYRPDNASDVFDALNTDVLEFAPATTEDELTLYFTRADLKALRRGDPDGFGIYVSTRSTPEAAFGPPKKIEAIRGYVEGPTVAPGGCAIYFHKLVDDIFRIQMAEKEDCAR